MNLLLLLMLAQTPMDYSVTIIASDKDHSYRGSGVLLEKSAITSAHLFDGLKDPVVMVHNGRESMPATLTKRDRLPDLALVRLDHSWKLATLAENLPATGARLRSYGLDASGNFHQHIDHVSTGLSANDGKHEILFTPAIFPNRSGGGLFDSDGKLVGITNAAHGNTGHAADLWAVKGFLDEEKATRGN